MTTEANQKQMASDEDIAIAIALGRINEARMVRAAAECATFSEWLNCFDFDEMTAARSIADYNRAWCELTGQRPHWADGPYTENNMPEIPKVPTSCTGVGPYDDADALAQLGE